MGKAEKTEGAMELVVFLGCLLAQTENMLPFFGASVGCVCLGLGKVNICWIYMWIGKAAAVVAWKLSQELNFSSRAPDYFT